MAAVDYFLKIDGIDGESQDSQYKNYIHVESWSWGASQSGTFSSGGGGGAGKVQMQDLHFTMKMDKASPKLMLACATGEHIKKAQLFARKAGKTQQTFLTVTLSDVLVSSYQTSGSGASDVLPIDSVALNFAKVEVEYKPQNADGSLGGAQKAGYDLKQMKTV
jgi:type VI secretion system secreted protein Hcp